MDVIDKEAAFLKRLLVTFKAEAQEHLHGMCSGLIRLEKNECPAEERAEIIETIFREAHSLKGAARAVNQIEIESLCQALEGVFAALKKNVLQTNPVIFDLLQEALDFLGLALPDVGAERTHKNKVLQRQLASRLEEVVGQKPAPETPYMVANVTTGQQEKVDSIPTYFVIPIQENGTIPPPSENEGQKAAPQTVMPDTVRVSTDRLTSVLLQAEEMLAAKFASSQRVLDIRSVSEAFSAWKKEWTRFQPFLQELKEAGSRGNTTGQIGESIERHRTLAQVQEFLDWNGEEVTSLEARLKGEVASAERDSRALGGMVNNLLGDMKKVLMFPFSSLLEILPKIIRDLSRDTGKKVELHISGEDIEIDRRILEEMRDPLLHLVRNCIDHGIENSTERLAKGKPQFGTIRVAVFPRDDKVELTVTDDGGGISPEAVRSALLKSGTISGDAVAELSDQELLAQVFQSGVTTSPIITEISGRGLGLAIVREKVEKMGGGVNVETALDSGTTFRITLPLTVATFRGILVRLGDNLFVLPAMHVARVLRVKASEIKTVENRETISLDGEPVSLARLASVLGLSAQPTERGVSELQQMVVLTVSNIRIAFLVDEIVSELEVLLKGLGRQLSRVRNVSGATVLGNGRVASVLNVPDLLKSAIRMAAFSTPRGGNYETGENPARRRLVLVVDDSITTRTLLKNILESGGYDVVTAVDGMDACTRLSNKSFDIVVSDVEMPRMNGFELTAAIRADKALREIPVVLITALASREDQERGVDVGANAYIVKSHFDQSNLLEVMKKLV
jgi:two-component system, chemotaxis family, sensor kinase CheA